MVTQAWLKSQHVVCRLSKHIKIYAFGELAWLAHSLLSAKQNGFCKSFHHDADADRRQNIVLDFDDQTILAVVEAALFKKITKVSCVF